MKTNQIAWLCGAVLALAGCGLADHHQRNSASQQPVAIDSSTQTSRARSIQADDSPVICTLERREQIITIKAGPDGAVYSVTTKDGTILHQNLSEEQLSAQAPDIHEFIKTSVAGGSGRGSAVIDAR